MITGLRVNAQARSELAPDLAGSDPTRLEFNRYGFYFRVLGESIFAQFAPDAGLLESAKRRRRIKHVVAVHPHRSRANVICDGVSLSDVLSPNRGRQPVERFVGALNDFSNVLET